MRNQKAIAELNYPQSARTDPRFYIVLLVGAVFIAVAGSVDPAQNCSEIGECAPWAVTIAFWIGWLAVLTAVFQLIRNPRWGSRVDHSKRTLFVWNEFIAKAPMSIDLDELARVEVKVGMDDDRIRFYLRDGAPVALPGADEVIPWPKADWARSLAAHYPHIAVVIE